jgi:hypothetical protein
MNDTAVILLGYIGPETMLPLASILAAGTGVLLMFWRFIVQGLRRIFGLILRRKKNVDAKDAPVEPPRGRETDG